MGALTHKNKQFTYRVWEQKSFIIIDDTEVYIYKLRSEHLKTKRVRILPVGYWIGNSKRYVEEPTGAKDVCIFFKRLCYHKSILRLKKSAYPISSIKGYKKILNILLSLYTINCFIIKKTIKRSLYNNLGIICDLLVNTHTIKRLDLPELTVNNLHKDILLFTNPRLDSAVLYDFLSNLTDYHIFTSFSTFVCTIEKYEIPLSNRNLIASIQGYYKIIKKTILTSCLNLSSFTLKFHPQILAPNYISNVIIPFIHESFYKPFILSTAKLMLVFSQPFASISVSHCLDTMAFVSLYIPKDVFDRFHVKKVNIKWSARVLLLFSLLSGLTFVLFSTPVIDTSESFMSIFSILPLLCFMYVILTYDTRAALEVLQFEKIPYSQTQGPCMYFNKNPNLHLSSRSHKSPYMSPKRYYSTTDDNYLIYKYLQTVEIMDILSYPFLCDWKYHILERSDSDLTKDFYDIWSNKCRLIGFELHPLRSFKDVYTYQANATRTLKTILRKGLINHYDKALNYTIADCSKTIRPGLGNLSKKGMANSGAFMRVVFKQVTAYRMINYLVVLNYIHILNEPYSMDLVTDAEKHKALYRRVCNKVRHIV
jgi:hypothetical protein